MIDDEEPIVDFSSEKQSESSKSGCKKRRYRKSEGKAKPRGSGKGRVAAPLHVYEQKVYRDIEARELEMNKLDRDCPEEEKKYIELRKRNYSQYDRLRKRRGEHWIKAKLSFESSSQISIDFPFL